MTVVTRFPPSPTGALHIGSARTALFNWLYARANDGKFVLRIEDTDRKRSTEAAVASIFDGLQWLGLDWDGEASFQTQNLSRHVEVAENLLASGAAYRCYCTPEELAEMREAAKARGDRVFYDRRWRDRSEAEAPADTPSVVRVKMPISGDTVIPDLVQGDVTVANEQLDDFILLRADGTPTYMLSVVVDDYDAGITHVIRGDDHLNNAFRQLQLYRAAGWTPPEYAHIPLIHGADGQKLSKRHGATSVQEYRANGILPATLRNYLLRLGWSHGDDEIISTAEAIEWFALTEVGRSAARFDLAKLENLNAHYLREAPTEELTQAIMERLAGKTSNDIDTSAQQRISDALPHLIPRAKTLVDLSESARFLIDPPTFPLAEQKAAKMLGEAGVEVLQNIVSSLDTLDDWEQERLDTTLRDRAAELELGFGKVAQPLRVALTGSTASPGIFDVMLLLGKEDSINRILAVPGMIDQ